MNTDDLGEMHEILKARLEGSPLGFRGVWIGDETLIPETPAVSIMGSKNRNMAETGWVTVNTFDFTIVIYHAELGSQNINRLDSIKLAESLESYLHQDRLLGDKVFTSHVTSITPGFSERAQQIMVSTRLEWQARSKTRM